MKRFVTYTLHCLILSSLQLINAQDTIQKQNIPLIKIQDSLQTQQLKDQKTQKKIKLPQAHLSTDLVKPIGEWIQQHSNAYVRSNGINSASTLSIRGASAAQTGLFWNDLPIRNSQSGMSDLNAFPNFFFEDAWILYEGQGSKLGAGSMGGALALYNAKNPKLKNNQLYSSTLLNWSSLNNFDFGQQVGFKNQNSSHQIKWLHSQYQQNFDYEHRGAIKSMDHSHSSRNALMTNHQWGFGKNYKNKIAIHSWLHQSNQEIPPTAFEQDSEKYLSTDFFKLQAHFNQQRIQSDWKSSLMFSTDHYEYKDWSINLFSPYDYGHLVLQNEWINYKDFRIRKEASLWTLTSYTKLPIEYAWIQLLQSDQPVNFKSFSVLLSQHISLENIEKGWAFEGGIGADYDYSERWNVLPSFSVKKNFSTISWKEVEANIFTGINIQKGFRKPTLIDLHLFPGGNKNLKSEMGWSGSAHAGIKINQETSEHKFWEFSSQVGYYQRKVDNWIYWLGGTIWTPYNIASVHNRGVETEHKFYWTNQPWVFQLNGTTAYNLATTFSSPIMDDNDLGKQIPYTPRYQFNLQSSLSYKKIELAWQGSYVGYRFTTLDKSAYMEPYFLHNMSFKTQICIRKINIYPEIKISNISNVVYEVISHRPMPKRYVEVGLKLDIHH